MKLIVLIIYSMTLWLGLNSDSLIYNLYRIYKNQGVQFTFNFESLHLPQSYKTSNQQFSIVECISLGMINRTTKAIYYELNNDLTIDCKLYSPLEIAFNDLMTSTSNKSMVFLRNDIMVTNYNYQIVKSISTNTTVNSLVALPNGFLASGSSGNKTIQIWNADSGLLVNTITVDNVNALAALHDGSLASGGSDNTIKIWNIPDGSLIRNLTGHFYDVFSLVEIQDLYLASGDANGVIKIWSLQNGSLNRNLTGHNAKVNALAALFNFYLASADAVGVIKIWKITDGTSRALPGQNIQLKSLAVLPSGYLACGNDNKTITIWSVKDLSLVRTLAFQWSSVWALVVLKNGHLVSGGGGDTRIKIWNTDEGSLITALAKQTGKINALAGLPNGSLAVGDSDGMIKIWS